MRSKLAVLNSLAAILLQIVTFLVGLILPRLILTTYGSTLNGLRASIAQIISYLYILEFGLSGSLVYSLYKPISDHDAGRISGIMAAARQQYNRVGLLFSALVGAAALLYPLLIQKEHIPFIYIFILVIAVGASGVIDYFTTAKYSVFLTAAQRSYVTSAFRVLYMLINTAIMIFLIDQKLPLSIVYLLALSSNLIYSGIYMLYMRRRYSFIRFGAPPDRECLDKRTSVLIHQISGMVVFNVPVLILTMIGSLKDVSIYSVYSIIFSGINSLISVFSNGFSSGFGDLIVNKKHRQLYRAYSEYEYFYYMAVAFTYVCALILGIPFIRIYTHGVTDANYIDPVVLILFTVIGVLNSWKMPQTTIIIAAAHYRQTRHRAIIEATVTTLSCIAFTYLWGIRGCLLGSIAGLCYRSIDLFYARHITRFRFRYSFLRLIRMFVLGAVALIPFYTVISIRCSSFAEWVLAALAVSVWVIAVVFTGNFFFEKKTMHHLINRMKNIIGHKEKAAPVS